MLHGPFTRCVNPGCDPGGTPLAANSDTDEIQFQTVTGLGSTNTGVAIFSTLPTSTNTYTVASTAAAGSSARIDRAGIYALQAQGADEEASVILRCGISLDGADLTTAFTFADAGIRAYAESVIEGTTNNAYAFCSGFAIIDAATAASTSLGFVRLLLNDLNTQHTATYLRITRLANFG